MRHILSRKFKMLKWTGVSLFACQNTCRLAMLSPDHYMVMMVSVSMLSIMIPAERCGPVLGVEGTKRASRCQQHIVRSATSPGSQGAVTVHLLSDRKLPRYGKEPSSKALSLTPFQSHREDSIEVPRSVVDRRLRHRFHSKLLQPDTPCSALLESALPNTSCRPARRTGICYEVVISLT